MLAWFLHVIWRMDPEDVDDAICDGGGDKGIDALDVNDDLREITVLQSKWHKKADGQQGDSDLKKLVGTAAYFEKPETVDKLLHSKPNPELVRLLNRKEIRKRVAEGLHATRLVFVTNGILDHSGNDFVAAMAEREPHLDVWDLDRLAAIAERTRRPELRHDRVTLRSSGAPTANELAGKVQMAVGLISAEELVRLPGIDDLSLFDRNVRMSLGRTRINREIEKTINDRTEHRLFPAYHNGLTMLTHGLKVAGDELRLDGITVVNGCQSLLALYRNRAELTGELRVLVKVVEVEAHSDLSDKITYRSNNQNPVDIRDQRSTDPIQRDLQAQVREEYPGLLAYAIREGEPSPKGVDILDNQAAAQLIMAVYLGEPWNAVRKVRLFDDEYRRIFSHAVDAHRLYFLQQIAKIIDSVSEDLLGELQASFASVRLTLAYLLAQVLRESERGKELLEEPNRWLPEVTDAVSEELRILAREVVESVNFHVEAEREEKGEDYDPKVAFKSHEGVRNAEHEVLRDTRRHARRDKNYLFDIQPIR